MMNEVKEIPAMVAAELVASKTVVAAGRQVHLLWADGRLAADVMGIGVRCVEGGPTATLRAWLVQQIEAGYRAGVEAGRAEAKPAPTDAAAESAAIDGLAGEAARLDSKNDRGTTLHHRDGDIAIFLEDTRSVYVRAWLRPWLLAAWARGVAYGQGDISTGESRCAAQLANALGHPGETLPTWEEALAMVTRDRQPTPGDFFGMAAREQVATAQNSAADLYAQQAAASAMVAEAIRPGRVEAVLVTKDGQTADRIGTPSDKHLAWLKGWLAHAWSQGQARAAAREQVAAERAVDAAAVALSDEDSIRATFVKSEIEGLRNQAEDLDNEVKNLRRSRDSAIAAARAEGAAEAFRKVVEWCQTAVPDGIDLDAGIVEEVAKDAIGTLQHAAGAGDEKMRDEGRRAGWKEAIAAANRARIVELRAAAKADGEMLRLRNELGAVEERHSQLVLRHEIAAAVLDAVTAAAPKETP